MSDIDLSADDDYEPGSLLEKPKTVTRRAFFWAGWSSFWVLVSLWSFSVFRYLVPRVSYEPSSIFKAGRPEEYPLGSVTLVPGRKVWIIREETGFYVMKAVCTHLSCQPQWIEREQIFKCPCHGGRFRKNGVNFAGPPPKPLERVQISLGDDGRLLINKDHIVDFTSVLKVSASF